MLNKLPAVLLGLGLLVLVAGTAQARSIDDVLASGYLEVAVYENYPPYSYSRDGVAKGVDVELARALAQGLGLTLKLRWMIADENLDDDLRNHVWKGHYLAREVKGGMLTHRVSDVMLRVPYDREFAFKRDPDGRVINDLVHFFAPYQRESWTIGFDSTQMEPFENLAAFQYARIGVEIDSLPDFYLSGAFRGALQKHVVHHSSFTSAVAAMDSGDVAAVMGQRGEVESALAGRDRQRFQIADVPMPNLIKRQWDVGMAVKDNYRQLAYRLEDVVIEMVKSGAMAEIYQQYGIRYEASSHYLVAAE